MESIKERNKEIQRKRKMMYFIEATQKIMEEEGTDHVTIRRVADIAGYNSATIYNYFKNLNHMIAFASIQYLENYNKEFLEAIKQYDDEYEKFIVEWKVFFKNAFEHPIAFEYIFFSGNENIGEIMKEYYEIFPVEVDSKDDLEEMHELLKLANFGYRNEKCLEEFSKGGYIKKENIGIINEITKCIALEYISIAAKQKEGFDKDKYIKKFISCINYLINKDK